MVNIPAVQDHLVERLFTVAQDFFLDVIGNLINKIWLSAVQEINGTILFFGKVGEDLLISQNVFAL
jgi:hypothetical protein